MAMLFFLPWVRLPQRFQVGEIEFIPYSRDSSEIPKSDLKREQIDAVLANYGDRSYTPGVTSEPVRNAVLLHWTGTEFGGDASDSDARARMEVGELVAMAGLSSRQYGSPFRYTNRDELRLIGQRFTPERPGAISVRSRRRDGSTNHMMADTGGQPRFLRPHHVAHQAVFNPDVQLLQSLLAASGHVEWPTILQAVSVYNLANSDADRITDDVELILHRVALETLLKASHRTADLRAKITEQIRPYAPTGIWSNGPVSPVVWQHRWPHSRRPIEAWVEDLCNARNKKAHGSTHSDGWPESVWSDSNHLMFSSWLFPYLLKSVLSNLGLYSISNFERDCLAGAETFFGHDVSHWDEDACVLKWNEVEGELFENELGRLLARGDGLGLQQSEES